MTRIKVCGITFFEDAKAAVELGVDALGFVFAESPRRITPKQAGNIIEKVLFSVCPAFSCTNAGFWDEKGRINFVGLFVNERIKSVEKTIKICRIDTLQFHGKESPEYCSYFRKKHNMKVIKTFRIKNAKSLEVLPNYDVDGYLLDTHVKKISGGTGMTFDWRIAKRAKISTGPVILAGGLNAENIKKAIEEAAPYGVDVSSGVEQKPGKKDLILLKNFIDAVKNYDRNRR